MLRWREIATEALHGFSMDKGSILLIEDDAAICDAMSDLLSSEGYEVHCAMDGQKALDWLRATLRLPHLILLDLMMPVLDGVQFRLRQTAEERLSGIPVIVISADTRGAEKSSCMGAQGYLRKPLEVDDLLDAVEHWTGGDSRLSP